MTARLEPLDLASALKTGEDIRLFLSEALSMNDPAYFAHVLAIAARSEGISQIADKMDLPEETLKAALVEDGKPDFMTVWKMLSALGFTIETAPAQISDAVSGPKERQA